MIVSFLHNRCDWHKSSAVNEARAMFIAQSSQARDVIKIWVKFAL